MTYRHTMGCVFVGIVVLMGVLLYIQPANVIDGFTTMLFEDPSWFAVGEPGSIPPSLARGERWRDNGALSCGPDHGGVCSQEGYMCINGFCKPNIPPYMPPYSDLPVRPAVSTWPTPGHP